MNLIELIVKALKARFKTPSRVLPKSVSMSSSSGLIVSEEAALKLGAYWACINILADITASLPLTLYKKDDGGGVEVKDHPLYSLLHNSPNADMTAYEFKSYIMRSLCVNGNFYALKVFSGGEIVALNVLYPDKTTPFFKGAEKLYRYNNPITGKEEEYKDSEIVHIPGFGYDGLKGFSVLSYMRDSIGAALSADRVASEAFISSGKAQGALLFKGKLSVEQRQNLFKALREQADEYNNSSSGAFLVLDEGTEIKNFNISPADLQMLENRKFSVEDVCRWFRVPPHMVGHSNVTTWGSGIEELSRGFITLTLQPTYLSRIQSALNKRLLPVEMQSEYSFEFKVQALIRANIIAQAAYYSTMLQNGVYSRNEVRGFLNMPPVEGGDEYTVQVNLAPINAGEKNV